MQPIQGNKLRIVLFEGTAQEVMLSTNRWLEDEGQMFEVVDIEFNYQGPEYAGKKKLTNKGTHGVLLVSCPLTINEVRQREGLEPFAGEHRCTAACVAHGEAGITHAD